MDWLHMKYEEERHADEIRAAQHENEVNALLAAQSNPAPSRRVRQTVGGKLIEWGKRLQENQNYGMDMERGRV